MATLLKRIMVHCTGRSILLFSLAVIVILTYSFIRIYMTKPETGRRLDTSSYRTSNRNPALQPKQQQQQQQQEKSSKANEWTVTLSENKAKKKEQQDVSQQAKRPSDEEPQNKLAEKNREEMETEKPEKKPEEKPEEKPDKKPDKEPDKKPDQKPEEKQKEKPPGEEKGTSEVAEKGAGSKKELKEVSTKKISEENQDTGAKEKQKALSEAIKSSEGVKSQKPSESQQDEKPAAEVKDDVNKDGDLLAKAAGIKAQPSTEGKQGRGGGVSMKQEGEEIGLNKKRGDDGKVEVKETNEELELDADDYNVPLEPEQAHQVVSEIQKTGNLLLDEFLSHRDKPPRGVLERWVHLDLKGAAPTLEYLGRLLPLLKQSGATGLLIEYEDMFPYSGQLEVVRSRRAYDVSALTDFLRAARSAGLQTVPLVQTFGHLEFVLKHTAFQQLREDPRYPAFLNPSKPEAIDLVQKMVGQIMALHADSKYIHIGCDEVYVIGVSTETMARMSQSQYGKAELYLDHVRTMARFVNSTYPGVQTLIWDDILRQISAEKLNMYAIGSYVEPVIWNYDKNVQNEITKQIWHRYSQVFSNIWVASAFKGASGSVQHLPELSRHLQNHASWLKVIDDVSQWYPSLHVKGFILTGWSRYDHFSALCELLPASLPSLVACLQMLASGTWNAAVIGKVSGLLQCSGPMFALNPENLHFEYASRVPTIDELLAGGSRRQCQFPGDRIFYLILFYHQALELFEKYFDPITGKTRGQCNRFSLGHNFADPFAIEKVCLRAAEKVSEAFRLVEQKIPLVFREIYSEGVAKEWLDEHVISFETWLEQYYNNLKTISSKPLVWGERPERPVDGALIDKGQHQPN